MSNTLDRNTAPMKHTHEKFTNSKCLSAYKLKNKTASGHHVRHYVYNLSVGVCVIVKLVLTDELPGAMEGYTKVRDFRGKTLWKQTIRMFNSTLAYIAQRNDELLSEHMKQPGAIFPTPCTCAMCYEPTKEEYNAFEVQNVDSKEG